MSPLRIQVLFHWESKEARRLARHLFDVFSARPTGEGPRISVRYGARRTDGTPSALLLEAEHEVIVLIADERMARRVTPSDRPVADAWGRLAADLVREHGPGTSSRHRVLPVALDVAALQLSASLELTSFVRLDVREGVSKDRHLTLHVAVRALRVLQNRPPVPAGHIVDDLPDVPLRMFISHAKRDLPADPAAMVEGPVRAVLSALSEVPVEGWFDASDIPPGGRFDEEIREGVLNSSVLLAILTDAWSTREWCRREVLEAKMAGRPMVVVDALQSQVVRLFPYIGNAPTLRWRAALATAATTNRTWEKQRRAWEAEDAARVVEAALLEALRRQYDYRRLLPRVSEQEIALGTAPEALTLAYIPTGTKRVWYPDPPLGREEVDRLKLASVADPTQRLHLTTPLTEVANWQPYSESQAVAVSLSGATDSEFFGGSPEHLAIFADDVVLYLLLAGLQVAYGGVLGHDALTGGAVEGDDINYVQRLLSVARSYSPLLDGISTARPKPIQNWVAWPIHCKYGDDEYRMYGQEAVLEALDAPPDLEIGPGVLSPSDSGFFDPDSPARRYAWARSLTFMREAMGKVTAARIVVGGKLTGYLGLWPGVLEEGIIALRAGKPLYALGVLGGSARLLTDLLQGADREEMSTAWFTAHTEGWDELRTQYARFGRSPLTPEALAAELKSIGSAGLALALNNGLSDAENLELIACDDSQRAVELILSGLGRKLGG